MVAKDEIRVKPDEPWFEVRISLIFFTIGSTFRENSCVFAIVWITIATSDAGIPLPDTSAIRIAALSPSILSTK